MRVLRTVAELNKRGWSREHLRRGERRGRWRLIVKGVYGEGPTPASDLDVARATAYAVSGIGARGLAGVLLQFDSVTLGDGAEILVPAGASNRRPGVRRVKRLPTGTVEVGQVRCTDGPTTLWDLAARLDDLRWEQALESALRKRLVTPEHLNDMAARPGRRAARVQRVVAARGGVDVPPTESLLETLMVQLIRSVPGLPPPERQVVVYDEHGNFVARVDLAWPALGIFIELDGQQHAGQPVYDASRQTRIAGATGWLCGRFTWYQVTRTPTAARRQIEDLQRQAHLRPTVPAT